jgi:hypothetical protein
MGPATIVKKYQARIKRIMREIRAACEEAGWYCSEIAFLDCDDYSWDFIVHTKGKPEEEADLDDYTDIDVTFKLCESEQYDGTKKGINFALDVVAVGGSILGGLTPYNYTSDVWVNRLDENALAERFQILQDADADGVVTLIRDFVQRRAA